METKNTILIVDDEPNALETLEGLLYSEGYQLLLARNVEEGMRYLGELNIDLILLDVMMPQMNGFDACWYFKRNPKWQHIPIILITALDSIEDLVKGLEAGADEFLTKPVMGVELRARVRTMLRIKHQYDELQNALKFREKLSNFLLEDMQAPLKDILLSVDVIRKITQFGESIQTRIDHVYDNARRLRAYTDNLLMLANMKSGSLELEKSPANLLKVLREIEHECAPLAKSRNVDLIFNLTADLDAELSLDVKLFERMLNNLITFILELSQWQNKIVVDAKKLMEETPDEPQFQIKIIDESGSIPEEYHDRIFEEHEIVSQRHKGETYIDVSLAFCKMVAKAHGGTIYMKKHEDRGSAFVIEI